jgi:IclR family acetate operon transcriptional repressor
MSRKPREEKEDSKEVENGAAGVRAVDRAIAILQCFSADQPALSVVEIQKRVGLSRPTLYRLLQTLAQRDLILAEGNPQRFRLSHGVMKLSHVWLKGLDVVALGQSIVEGLRDLTGETSALFKLQEDRGICILECESRHVLSISRGVGDSSSLTKGSTGKAMLGFMEPQRQSEILSTIPRGAQRARLEEEIKLARQRGYATSSGEIFVGAVAVSAPYFDHRGSVMGSVGIYGPSARVDERQMIEYSKLVRKAGREISVLLGYQEREPTVTKDATSSSRINRRGI